jgi:hypothetical protein
MNGETSVCPRTRWSLPRRLPHRHVPRCRRTRRRAHDVRAAGAVRGCRQDQLGGDLQTLRTSGCCSQTSRRTTVGEVRVPRSYSLGSPMKTDGKVCHDRRGYHPERVRRRAPFPRAVRRGCRLHANCRGVNGLDLRINPPRVPRCCATHWSSPRSAARAARPRWTRPTLATAPTER